MDGTLSPDGGHVLHMSEWIPAVLSPDYSWYSHEGQWHPLSPPSIKLARIQKNKSLNRRYGNPAESNQTSSGNAALFLLGIIVSLWFILDSSGRGLTHPGILEISWLEMAGANCSVLDEPLFDDLAHDCYEAVRQAQVFMAFLFVFFAVFVALLLGELGKGSGTVNTPASARSRGPSVCEHGQSKSLCMCCAPNGALNRLLRARVRGALSGQDKACSTPELLGCSIEVCRKHLEDQFWGGMIWENHDLLEAGTFEWHIDYRRPCASFDLQFEEQQRMCFHYTNLQPMWGPQSSSKSSSFDEDSFEWEWTGEEWEFTGSDVATNRNSPYGSRGLY